MELIVKLVSGDCRSVHVNPSATVGELKRAVAQSFNEALSSVQLFTNNGARATLDNDTAPLSSFGLSSGSTVMLLLRTLSVFQVFVKNLEGKTKTYDVNEEETVDDLQRKIYNKERTPVDQQRLMFAGKQLEARRKLKDYNITNGSTIQMTLRLRGG